MSRSRWVAGSIICLLVVLIIWIADYDASSDPASKIASQSVTPSATEGKNDGKRPQETAESNPLTDHDTNHEWLISSTAKLAAQYQRLPAGDIRDSVASLLRAESTLEEANERGYRRFAAMSAGNLASWADEDLKFGTVTAERFAAVSIETTANLFDDSFKVPPNDNPVRNISGRAKEASKIIANSYVVLDRADAHPLMLQACPEDVNELKSLLSQAKLLLLKSQQASETPTVGYVLVANAEMLSSEVDARNTCFKGWDLDRPKQK